MRYLTHGIFRGVICLFPDPATNSGTTEDLSVFTPGSSVSLRMALAAMVQLPSGDVSSARSPSPP